MSADGLEVFDSTLQTTHVWLDEIMGELDVDRKVAWHVLGAVLRTIRDRVPIGLAVHLGAQLPLIVRGLYYDQFRPEDIPDESRSYEEFAARLGLELATLQRLIVPRDAIRAVCATQSRHVSGGQVEKVIHALPEPVREDWLAIHRAKALIE